MPLSKGCLSELYPLQLSRIAELAMHWQLKGPLQSGEDIHKGFASYTECMTKALFTGLSSFALTFSVLYFSQVLLKSRLPYKPKYYLIGPSIISTLVSWTVTSRKTQICQDIWKSSEPHYTGYEEK